MFSEETVWDFFTTILTLAKEWVWPLEGELILFRIVCTILMLISLFLLAWSNENTRKALNYVGAVIVAIAVFLILFRLLIHYPMMIWNWFVQVHWFVKAVIIFVFVASFIGALFIKGVKLLWAGIVWAYKTAKRLFDAIKSKPHAIFMTVGALFLTGLMCGEKATMLTEEWARGIIPGTFGAIGLILSFVRLKSTDVWKEVSDWVKLFFGGTLADLTYRCGYKGPMPLYTKEGNAIPDVDGKPRFKTRHKKCRNKVKPTDQRCTKCGSPNKHLSWTCGCGHKEGKDVPWHTPFCPSCGGAKPPRQLPKHFPYPGEGFVNSEEALPAVLPTAQAVPTAQAQQPQVQPQVAPPTAPTKEAGHYVWCSCGERNFLSIGLKYCVKCSKSLREAPLKATSVPLEEAPPTLHELLWRTP